MKRDDTTEFPGLMPAVIGINIVTTLIYGFTGSYLARRFLFIQPVYDFYHISVICLLNIACLCGIAVNILIESRSRYSYASCTVCAAANTALAVLAALVAVMGPPVSWHGVLFLSIFCVSSAWMIFIVLRPSHVRWARRQGSLFATVINIPMILLFVLLWVIPACSAAAFNTIGVTSEISPEGIVFAPSSGNDASGSGGSGRSPRGVSAAYGREIREWVRIEIGEGAGSVSKIGITIPEGMIASMRGSAGEVIVEMSDGTKVLSRLSNRAGEQMTDFPGRKVKWLRVLFRGDDAGRVIGSFRPKVRLFTIRKNMINFDISKAFAVL